MTGRSSFRHRQISQKNNEASSPTQPAMVTVNKQAVYLAQDRKLNVRSTFGANVFLYDSAGTMIPLDAAGKTEFMLQNGCEYTVKTGISMSTVQPPKNTSPKSTTAGATPKKTIAPMKWTSPGNNKAIFRGFARAAAHPYGRPAATTLAPRPQISAQTALPAKVEASQPQSASGPLPYRRPFTFQPPTTSVVPKYPLPTRALLTNFQPRRSLTPLRPPMLRIPAAAGTPANNTTSVPRPNFSLPNVPPAAATAQPQARGGYRGRNPRR